MRTATSRPLARWYLFGLYLLTPFAASKGQVPQSYQPAGPASKASLSPRWNVLNLLNVMAGNHLSGASTRENLVIIATHRGDWKDYPENSESAIREAIENGSEAVELDVQPTADQFPDTYNLNGGSPIPGCILAHDTGTMRLTDPLLINATQQGYGSNPPFTTLTEKQLLGLPIRASHGQYLAQRAGNTLLQNAPNGTQTGPDHFMTLYDALQILTQYTATGANNTGLYFDTPYYTGATGPLLIIDVKLQKNDTDAEATKTLAGCTTELRNFYASAHNGSPSYDVPLVNSVMFKFKLSSLLPSGTALEAVTPSQASGMIGSACRNILDSQGFTGWQPTWKSYPRLIVGVLNAAILNAGTNNSVGANPIYSAFKNAYVAGTGFATSGTNCMVQFEFDQSNLSGQWGKGFDPSKLFMDDLNSSAGASRLGYGYATWQLPYFEPEGFTTESGTNGIQCCTQYYNDTGNDVPTLTQNQFIVPDFKSATLFPSSYGETSITTDTVDGSCALLSAKGKRVVTNVGSSPLPICQSFK